MVTQGVSITTRLASSFHTVDASRSRQHVRALTVFQTLGHDAQVRLTLAGCDHFPGEPFATAAIRSMMAGLRLAGLRARLPHAWAILRRHIIT